MLKITKGTWTTSGPVSLGSCATDLLVYRIAANDQTMQAEMITVCETFIPGAHVPRELLTVAELKLYSLMYVYVHTPTTRTSMCT